MLMEERCPFGLLVRRLLRVLQLMSLRLNRIVQVSMVKQLIQKQFKRR